MKRIFVAKEAGISPTVVIVAQNASTEFGGESFIPFKYFQLLQQRGYAVKLVTHARNRDNLEREINGSTQDVRYISDNIFHKVFWRLSKRLPNALKPTVSHGLMALAGAGSQAAIIRDLIRTEPQVVLHQPTPVSPRLPTALHRFGVPLVIGPLNGGMEIPPGFEQIHSRKNGRVLRWARLLSRPANALIRGKHNAFAVLAANQRTINVLSKSIAKNAILLSENGIDPQIWNSETCAPQSRSDGSFELVFVGALIRWKAVDVTIRAVSRVRAKGVNVHLTVIGQGPERHALGGLCDKLGLQDAVTFTEFLPQPDIAKHFASADALILNSLYECGGSVVLEAMAMGLPVVASNWGGPSEYLDETCGILVEPTPSDSFDDRLALAIEKLANNPELAREMGACGKAKVRAQYDWNQHVDRMIEIYELAAQS